MDALNDQTDFTLVDENDSHQKKCNNLYNLWVVHPRVHKNSAHIRPVTISISLF